MFASDIATITIFSGLGLVGLSLGLLARRYSKPALAVGLLGLLPLAGGTTWLARSAPFEQVQRLSELTAEQDNAIGRQQQEITQLRRTVDMLRSGGSAPVQPPNGGPTMPDNSGTEARLAELMTQLQKAGADLATAIGDRNQARTELATEAERRQKLEALIAKASDRRKPITTTGSTEAIDVRKLQSDLEVARSLLTDEKRQHERTKGRAEAASARVVELERELVNFRNAMEKPAEAVASPPPPRAPAEPSSQPQAAGPDVRNLLGLMDKRIETSFYISEPIPNEPQLVAGSSGRWYRIALKTGGGQPLIFPDRQFEVAEEAAAVAISSQHMVTDFLAKISRTAKSFRVFVRGGADGRRVLAGADQPGIAALKVYARGEDGRYPAAPELRRIATPLRNEDLPLLRANWLRGVIGPALGDAGVTDSVGILDNPPAPGEARTAEVILFVDW